MSRAFYPSALLFQDQKEPNPNLFFFPYLYLRGVRRLFFLLLETPEARRGEQPSLSLPGSVLADDELVCLSDRLCLRFDFDRAARRIVERPFGLTLRTTQLSGLNICQEQTHLFSSARDPRRVVAHSLCVGTYLDALPVLPAQGMQGRRPHWVALQEFMSRLTKTGPLHPRFSSTSASPFKVGNLSLGDGEKARDFAVSTATVCLIEEACRFFHRSYKRPKGNGDWVSKDEIESARRSSFASRLPALIPNA